MRDQISHNIDPASEQEQEEHAEHVRMEEKTILH